MKLKKSMKIRVNAKGISFYTTVKQIQEGVGSSSDFNDAVKIALITLKDRIEAEHFINGVLGTWIGYQIQLDIVQ
jgi:hypothetical protein